MHVKFPITCVKLWNQNQLFRIYDGIFSCATVEVVLFFFGETYQNRVVLGTPHVHINTSYIILTTGRGWEGEGGGGGKGGEGVREGGEGGEGEGGRER